MSDSFLQRLQSADPGEDREWLVLQYSLRALSPALREAAQASAVPHWFDLTFLAALIGQTTPDTRPLFDGLTALSFVEPFPDHSYNVHHRTRALLLKRLWRDDQDRFRALSARAAQHCAEQDLALPAWRVEWIYHLLVAAPDEGLQRLEDAGREWRLICAYDRVEALVRAAEEHANAERLSEFGVALTKYWGATVHRDYSRYPAARDGFEEARALFRDLRQDLREANALYGAAEVYHFLDEYATARERYEDARHVYHRIENKTGEARATLGLADINLVFCELETARHGCEEARRIFHDIGDRENEGVAIRSLGEVHQALGEYETAASEAEEGYQLSKAAGSRYGEARSLQDRGAVHRALGEYDKARRCYDEALGIYRRAAARQGEAYCLEGLGILRRDLGDYPGARQCYQEACVIFLAIRDRRGRASSLRGLGDAYRGLGDPRTARQHYEEARQICREIRDAQGEADCILGLADLDGDAAHWWDAQAGYRHALDQYRSVGTRPRIALALRGLGRVLKFLGDTERARSHLAEAKYLFAAMGSPRAAEVDAELAAI
jgi:tetratricopeptide (TPR) repeat protein